MRSFRKNVWQNTTNLKQHLKRKRPSCYWIHRILSLANLPKRPPTDACSLHCDFYRYGWVGGGFGVQLAEDAGVDGRARGRTHAWNGATATRQQRARHRAVFPPGQRSARTIGGVDGRILSARPDGGINIMWHGVPAARAVLQIERVRGGDGRTRKKKRKTFGKRLGARFVYAYPPRRRILVYFFFFLFLFFHSCEFPTPRGHGAVPLPSTNTVYKCHEYNRHLIMPLNTDELEKVHGFGQVTALGGPLISMISSERICRFEKKKR